MMKWGQKKRGKGREGEERDVLNRPPHCDICDRPLTRWDQRMGRRTCGRLACQKVGGITYAYNGKRRPRTAASEPKRGPE